MKHRMTMLCSALLAALVLSGCVSQRTAAVRSDPPRLQPLAESDVRTDTGRAFYLIGQPSPQALEDFADLGGATVVNLRSDGELEYLPFYGATAAHACGLEYEHIPLTASTFSPDAYSKFAAAIEGTDGPVLMHCASGGRARAMYAVHLAKTLGYDADTAIARVHSGEDPAPAWLIQAVYLGLGLPVPQAGA